MEHPVARTRLPALGKPTRAMRGCRGILARHCQSLEISDKAPERGTGDSKECNVTAAQTRISSWIYIAYVGPRQQNVGAVGS